MNRRDFLASALGLSAYLVAPRAGGQTLSDSVIREHGPLSDRPREPSDPGNFHRIYTDTKLSDRFYLFLQNVFHLYPEDLFHQLIIDLVSEYDTDQEIYKNLLKRIPDIKPILSELTYAIPALRKQKLVMADQSMEFLGATTSIDGYTEIGSPGRYFSELRGRVNIGGAIFIINDIAPSYSPADIAERRGIWKIGSFIPMGEYDAFAADQIPDDSIDLVTNFIGFHHCPTDRLEGFVGSIHRVIRPGGRLLLRDHDVDSPGMEYFVALAHDVFNAGVSLSWEENHRQIRLFRSIDEWTKYLESAGFERASERRLAQELDPTENLMVEFVKA